MGSGEKLVAFFVDLIFSSSILGDGWDRLMTMENFGANGLAYTLNILCIGKRNGLGRWTTLRYS